MSFLIDIIYMITQELCSWRVGLCLLIAVAIVFGLFITFPEHNGFLPLSAYASIIVISIGFLWQYLADRK